MLKEDAINSGYFLSKKPKKSTTQLLAMIHLATLEAQRPAQCQFRLRSRRRTILLHQVMTIASLSLFWTAGPPV